MWAPGLVAPGSTIMEVVSSVDIFPTTLSLAGVPLPTDRVLDGKDTTPLLTGVAGAVSPHEWLYYYTTCTELMGCPPFNVTNSTPSDRIAAVRSTRNGMKCHFFTHSGQGNEPYVLHDPPLCFNVERDPGEKEPVTPRTWDGGPCGGRDCLAEFIQQATAAATRQHQELVWCEYCAADGVSGRSMLSATEDYSVMDCRGLNPEESGCCERKSVHCG